MGRITPAQVRGARGMLDWSISDLALASGVSGSTIKRMEKAEPGPVSDAVHATVAAALEKADIRFTSNSERGVGVWLDYKGVG